MSNERIELARAILDERVGANGLSDSQLEVLGWDTYKFAYYGRPTAEENKRKATEIIAEASGIKPFNYAIELRQIARDILEAEYPNEARMLDEAAEWIEERMKQRSEYDI